MKTAEQRARDWAEARDLRESQRWYRDCLHGLTERRASSLNCDCPRGDSEVLDHARLWNRDGRPAFLLAHIYGDVSPGSPGRARAEQYAASFGVRLVIGDCADAWYGFGTTPLRYEPFGSVPVRQTTTRRQDEEHHMTHGQRDVVPGLQRAVRVTARNRVFLARVIEGCKAMAEREAAALGATDRPVLPARAVRKPMTSTPED